MNSGQDLTVQLQRMADAESADATTAGLTATRPYTAATTSPAADILQAGQYLGHYRIEASIGQGGTGMVYRAHDAALERSVAIKRIHQRLCAGDWDHLKREATALMRLQHPNIATFHDLGERGDVAWLVMEYVEGQALSAHLAQTGTLDQKAILHLADGLLCALGHAHAAGVIHADIKPENIMLTVDDQVKVLDFGIARLVHDIDLPDDLQYTRNDTVSGSPGFMSPEQLRSSGMDARSDLFAVAAVLFQAASGEAAFPGATAADRIRSVLSHRPGEIAGRLPGPLGELLDQAMHPEIGERPASAAEMLYSLRQVLTGSTAPEPARSQLLLAPWTTTGAGDLDWLGRALNNALRPVLEQTGRFELIPEARAAEMHATTDSGLELAQKLAARWVVHGQIERDGDAICLTLAISDVPTARQFAERKASTPLEQLFTLQDQLAGWVAEQLSIDTMPAGAQPQWDAVAQCAQGETAFARGGKDGLAEAAGHFARALDVQPDSTEALAGLAGVHAMRFTFTSNPEDISRARQLAEKALDIDPNAHAARQWLIYALMRQHKSDEAMRQALIMMKSSSDAHMACYFTACCLASEARYEDALRFYQISLRINATRSWSWFGAGNCHNRLGKLDNAQWCLERAVDAEISASHFTTAGCGAYLAELLRTQGKLEPAWKAAKQALARVEASDFIYRDSFRALALISLGRIALDRDQRKTAEAAFHQAELGIRGRPKALGAGHLLVQALAGKASARRDPGLLDLAENTLKDRGAWNFDWLWGCHQKDSLQALEQSRQQLANQAKSE